MLSGNIHWHTDTHRAEQSKAEQNRLQVKYMMEYMLRTGHIGMIFPMQFTFIWHRHGLSSTHAMWLKMEMSRQLSFIWTIQCSWLRFDQRQMIYWKTVFILIITHIYAFLFVLCQINFCSFVYPFVLVESFKFIHRKSSVVSYHVIIFPFNWYFVCRCCVVCIWSLVNICDACVRANLLPLNRSFFITGKMR